MMGEIKCQGRCEQHAGPLVRVEVRDIRHGKDWGMFTYCQNAIESDRLAGLDVSAIEGTEVPEAEGGNNDE